jgi:DNA repair protein RecO (recombination protein O)
MNRLFNFKIGTDSQRLLNEVTEKYILAHLSRSFKTLDFYKQMCADEASAASTADAQ